MPRGGWRGGGRPLLYQNQPTKTIRVPEAFADELIQFAQRLDSGESVSLHQRPKNEARAREILNNALTLKANAGGAIKAKIREALILMSE